MEPDDDTRVLRARDFWASLVLIGLSLFFLWKTSRIPFFGGNRAGVADAGWFSSAALVPFGIFGGLLVLACVLLVVAIRSGGAARALSGAGIGWNKFEALRFGTILVCLLGYVAGLVPRVDFVLSSGLLITALIYGYHGNEPRRMALAAVAVGVPALYAGMVHLPQSEWKAHDDDLVTQVVFAALTVWVLGRAKGDRWLRWTPVIAVTAPLILVCAMAFGFRQNVPNRSGLIFSQIEYHYYVTLKPMWSE